MPANWFIVGYSYRVSSSITFVWSDSTDGSSRRLLSVAEETAIISADTTVEPAASALVAHIIGGDRARSSLVTVRIDGSLSSDPDLSVQAAAGEATITYRWTINDATSGDDIEFASYTESGSIVHDVNASTAVLSLPPSSLSMDSTFVVTLLVSSLFDGRTAATAVRLTTTSNSTMMTLIRSAPAGITTVEPLRIVGTTVHATGTGDWTQLQRIEEITYAWTIRLASDVDDDTASLLDLTNTSIVASTPNSSELILRAGLLTPGEYRARVVATDDSTDPLAGYLLTDTAAVVFTVYSPPTAGACTLTPLIGLALNTTFTANCSGWGDANDEWPLRYAYQVVDASDDEATATVLTFPSRSSAARFFLPAGSWLLRASITDAVGAVSTVSIGTATVTSTITDITLSDIDSYLTSLLEPAITLGDDAASLRLIMHLSTMVNDAMELDATMAADALAVQIVASLVADAHTIIAARTDADAPSDPTLVAFTQLATSALSSLTEQAEYYSPATWSAALNATDAGIALRLSTLTADEDDQATLPTAEATELTTVLTNLLTNCSRLDAISDALQQLMTATQTHLLSGETTTLTSSAFTDTAYRIYVASGVSIAATNSTAAITLSASSLASYAASLDNTTAATIDVAAGGTLPTMDVRVVTWSTEWGACSGSLTSVTLTDSTGSTVTTNSSGATITFSQAVIAGSVDSLTSAAEAAAFACGTDYNVTEALESSIECAYYDTTTGALSTDGCSVQSITVSSNDQVTVVCACDSSNDVQVIITDTASAECVVVSSSPVYLVFLALYAVLGVGTVAMYVVGPMRVRVHHAAATMKKYDAQSGRIAVWRISAAATMPMRVEYSMLVVMCALRILHTAVYYKLESSLSSGVQMLLTHLPYVLVPALCVLGHLWLQRYHKYRSMPWQSDDQVITKSADVPCLVSRKETHWRRILTAVIGGIVMFALTVVLTVGESTLDTINRIATILPAAAYFALVALCVHTLKQHRSSTSAGAVTKFNQLSESAATDSRAKTPFVQPASHVWAAVQCVAATAAACGIVLVITAVLDSASTGTTARALRAAYFSSDLVWLASLLAFWYLLRRAELRRQAHFLGTMRTSASAEQIEMNPLHHTGWHQSSSPDESSEDSDSDADVVSSTDDATGSTTGGGPLHSISDETRSKQSASVMRQAPLEVLSPVQLVEEQTTTGRSSPPMSPLQLAAAAAGDRDAPPPPPSVFGATDEDDIDELFGPATGFASSEHQKRMHQWMLVTPVRPEDGIWAPTQNSNSKRTMRLMPIAASSQHKRPSAKGQELELVSTTTSWQPPQPVPPERISSPGRPPLLPSDLVTTATTTSPDRATSRANRPILSRGQLSLSSLVLGHLQDHVDSDRAFSHVEDDEGDASINSTPRGASTSVSSASGQRRSQVFSDAMMHMTTNSQSAATAPASSPSAGPMKKVLPLALPSTIPGPRTSPTGSMMHVAGEVSASPINAWLSESSPGPSRPAPNAARRSRKAMWVPVPAVVAAQQQGQGHEEVAVTSTPLTITPVEASGIPAGHTRVASDSPMRMHSRTSSSSSMRDITLRSQRTSLNLSRTGSPALVGATPDAEMISPIMRPTGVDQSDSCASPSSIRPSMGPSLSAWSSPPPPSASRRSTSSASRRVTSSPVMSSQTADDESSFITADRPSTIPALINPALSSRRAMRLAQTSAAANTSPPIGSVGVGRLARPRSIQQ